MASKESSGTGCLILFLSPLTFLTLVALSVTIDCGSLDRDKRLGLNLNEKETSRFESCQTTRLNMNNWE